MTTVHTRQLQQYTRSTNYNYTQHNLKLATKHTRQILKVRINVVSSVAVSGSKQFSVLVWRSVLYPGEWKEPWSSPGRTFACGSL